MADTLIYRPGRNPARPWPLARYLPRLPVGSAAAWLHEHVPPGSWVIDPFGASPQLAVEAAQAGYRVLVAANNPISHFLIEMAAQPPQREEMVAALSSLAAARRGEERLELHIQQLYQSECDNCDAPVTVEAFLWAHEDKAPYARIYTCGRCQHSGEYPATAADIARAGKFSAGGLHRARALERVAKKDAPDRAHAEEALDAYLPRAVYVLLTLVNNLDGIPSSQAERRLLTALLLSACDQANTLWRTPAGPERPKQLGRSANFREHNIWLALERAIDEWSGGQGAALSRWPEPPPQTGGICLYEGRMSSLAEHLYQVELKAVVSALPRPNQAFWTLSALWAGWLWGRQAVGEFAHVLSRRRYDWAWHTRALASNLGSLAVQLATGTPFYGLVTESEPGFDAAAVLAAELAGFQLAGAAVRRKQGQSQFLWRRRKMHGGQPAKADDGETLKTVQRAAQELLHASGQPAGYLRLQDAVLLALSQEDQLGGAGLKPAEAYTDLMETMAAGLTYRGGFLRIQGSDSTLDSGYWWLRDDSQAEEPLADRVEKSVVTALVETPQLSWEALEDRLCREFPGLLTPPEKLVRSVLRSYAAAEGGGWKLRPADTPASRRSDLKEMQAHLTRMGEKFGYEVEGDGPLVWLEKGKVRWHFHITASAVLGGILKNAAHDPEKGIIVLPGGRARLVMNKLAHNPVQRQQIEQGWRFLKFRWLRGLAENPNLSADSLAGQLALDPLAKEDAQLPLL